MEDQSKWFLIDWEDGATPSTRAQPSFTKETHSPDAFHDGHGQEVDIWVIGHLIRTLAAAWLSVETRRLGERNCKESRKLSAQCILALLGNCHLKG